MPDRPHRLLMSSGNSRASPTSDAVRANPSRSISIMAIRHPAFASRTAVAAPIPDAAPVTITTPPFIFDTCSLGFLPGYLISPAIRGAGTNSLTGSGYPGAELSPLTQ